MLCLCYLPTATRNATIHMKVKVAQSCLTLCDPMDYTVHGILQTRILEWVAFPFSRGSSQPRSPALQVGCLPAEPQGKPKNTRMDSLSLLQYIFLTQESNWDLLHCRQILYQQSSQGNPPKYQSILAMDLKKNVGMLYSGNFCSDSTEIVE